MRGFACRTSALVLSLVLVAHDGWMNGLHAADANLPIAADAYEAIIRPLLQKYCAECHSGDRIEAEVDLASLASFDDLKQHTKLLIRLRQMIDSGQMPPPESEALPDESRTILQRWVRGYLTVEAAKRAGDPGAVVLRRLSNAEYNYTLQDLTGVDSLDPTREFPVDGAAGEGFTNTGSALVMSPSLVTKYLEAGKKVAEHLVLLPDGIRFSQYTTRRDRTDELMARIQAFYRQFTDDGGGSAVNLQGIEFTTNQGGRLPIERYLEATLAHREALRQGTLSLDEVARQQGLNAKYFGTLWQLLNDTQSAQRSFLNESIRAQWETSRVEDVPKLRAAIETWQQAVWKFNSVGQIGREGSASVWMEGVQNVASQQDLRLKLPDLPDGQEVVVYLSAMDAGDGNDADWVIWKRPRLEGGGRPPLFLRDAAGWQERLAELRGRMELQTIAYLNAAAEARDRWAADAEKPVDLEVLAAKHTIDARLLQVWLDYLDLGPPGTVPVEGHFTQTLPKQAGYDFINGWGLPETPSITANSSDQEVRIPGLSRPNSVVVHPSPTQFIAVGWRSPIAGRVTVEMQLVHAHPECGNGIEWIAEHRTRLQAFRLGSGEVVTAASGQLEKQTIDVRLGELVSLFVGPRNGDHGCDLTQVQIVIREMGGMERVWDLAKDVSPNLLVSNPHADSFGNAETWHFYRGEMARLGQGSRMTPTVPAGSILARWLAAPSSDARASLAAQVDAMVRGQLAAAAESDDAKMVEQLKRLPIPPDHPALVQEVPADRRFGAHPLGDAVESQDLVVRAPQAVEIRLPAALARGRELVVTGSLDAQHGTEGSVQLQATLEKPAGPQLRADLPLIVHANSQAEQRIRQGLDDFRQLFPPALCYARIVPVDEVVTLVLFYREDHHLQRLMLDDQQKAELDRLWDELFYVTQEPLQLEVSFEQIREFATQDRPDLVVAFKSLIEPITGRAKAFRQRLIDTEPAHVEGLVGLADRVWRRPVTDSERQAIRDLYSKLRQADVAHEEAVHLTFARMITSPSFLYKREQPGPGSESVPVNDHELATRLSYFLWSSAPDPELRAAADAGKLTAGDHSILIHQTRRMLADARTRRLAIQFACQWLHVRDFDQNDEKNENLFPEFATLRHDMYEETVRFFEDMFRNDGSVLGYLNADHTFLNESLARHYGIEGVQGTQWRKVTSVRPQGRGGVLGMATVLASQSGASRTSPILRGNWVSETLLGERLPKPPANVPQLPEEVPVGLNERQLIERHSSDPACAKCHKRIDPYGFSLEQYDAIGRRRLQPMDTHTTLIDGKAIEGLDGLRNYLAVDRHDDVLRHFCQKLLGYALGREVQFSDEPLLAEMQQRLAENEYRFSVAVETIVMSEQFRKIRGQENGDEE